MRGFNSGSPSIAFSEISLRKKKIKTRGGITSFNSNSIACANSLFHEEAIGIARGLLAQLSMSQFDCMQKCHPVNNC